MAAEDSAAGTPRDTSGPSAPTIPGERANALNSVASLQIRRARRDDAGPISALIAPLAREFAATGAAAEARRFLGSVGRDSVARYIESPEFIYLVGLDRAGSVAGVAAVRGRSHLYHLFVAAPLQGQGVGRRLWEAARAASFAAGHRGGFTVNAVPGAVAVYERFGFRAAGPPVERDGIRFVPMRLGRAGDPGALADQAKWRFSPEPCQMAGVVHESSLHSLPLLSRGKVRDNYAVGQDRLLIVTTDRLSAFDVVMAEPIPDKGRVLNRMALFWFDRLADVVPNHLSGVDPETVVAADEREQVRDRSMLVKRLKPILVEAVVRGYLIGSGWKDYQASGAVCGIRLPAGLQMADRLPEPIFTPAAKADLGEHDENIDFDEMAQRTGGDLAERIRTISLELYRRASDYAEQRGIIIADTKFEFGLDDSGVLHLMDEVLTADSSRFWPADEWRPGISPPSFDKQFVRDWLDSVPGWDKRPPPPALPAEVVERTASKYREALRRLTGIVLEP